ncbi:MAG: hypothetical protein KDE59_30295 [Anaerolineales bacterium]|nr:hypothetical protein [Anaerolineales bacterium]
MMRQTTRFQWLAGLVLLLGVLLYLPGLPGPLLFDDKPALTVNPLVQIKGGVFDEWRVAALSSGSGPLRRPIAMLSFAANHAIAGDFSPLWLKAVNLGIHLAAAISLYFLCLTILDELAMGRDKQTRRLVALTAAAIWLLHPLNVSTVLYAVQRMAQLATLFVLAGLLLFMHYRRRWARAGASTGEVLAAALWLLLLTLGAALSKENGALLPWLCVVLEVCIFRGLWSGHPCRWLGRASWLALLLPVALVLVLLAVVPDFLVAGYAGREFTLEERLLTQARLLWHYLGWLVLPNINDMGFQHDDIVLSAGLFAPWTTLAALLAWVVTLVAAVALRRRFPLLLLAVLFFLVGHSMESSVWPLEMVYEHRNYLPGTMLCLVLAAAIVIPATSSKNVSVYYPIFGVLAVLGLLLFVRVQYWSDELALSRSNASRHPESSRSNYFYANALLRHYRRGEQRGLSDTERTESLLLSRHYFERMYQTNDRDVAALAMLYYLDSRYFTRLQEQVDWLAALDELLDNRRLQASDWNALAMLFEVFAAESDRTDEATALGLLDKLAKRYPESLDVLRYRYNYLSARGAEQMYLLALLQTGQERAPADPWFYQRLIYEYSLNADFHNLYRYAGLWLQNDSNRYHLHEIKRLFDAPSLPQADSP